MELDQKNQIEQELNERKIREIKRNRKRKLYAIIFSISILTILLSMILPLTLIK